MKLKPRQDYTMSGCLETFVWFSVRKACRISLGAAIRGALKLSSVEIKSFKVETAQGSTKAQNET